MKVKRFRQIRCYGFIQHFEQFSQFDLLRGTKLQWRQVSHRLRIDSEFEEKVLGKGVGFLDFPDASICHWTH